MSDFTMTEVAECIREFIATIPSVNEKDVSTVGDVDEIIRAEFGGKSQSVTISRSDFERLFAGYISKDGVKVECVGVNLGSGELYFEVVNRTL